MSERDAEVLDRLHAELIRQANRHREGQIPLDGSTVAEWKKRRAWPGAELAYQKAALLVREIAEEIDRG